MRVFRDREIFEAYEYANGGGQALHLHRIVRDRRYAPRCFVAAIDRGENIAHLFDQDAERLIQTARSLGVRTIYVDKAGTRQQHIDLCGAPLRKAVALCSRGNVELR